MPRSATEPWKAPGKLPRLPPEYYQGDAVVHWSMPTWNRTKGWLDERFHAGFRELMLHASAREALFCPAYILMPDHLHFIWMGLQLESDQQNGVAFLRTYLEKALSPEKFQPQAYDHVLRAQERLRGAFATGCSYVLDNPLRGALVSKREDWRFLGCIVPGYPTLHPLELDYWPKFWKIVSQKRSPEAGKIIRPPFNLGV
jgi:putative transposase